MQPAAQAGLSFYLQGKKKPGGEKGKTELEKRKEEGRGEKSNKRKSKEGKRNEKKKF